jgi:pyruvate formate lyase activating enzyme
MDILIGDILALSTTDFEKHAAAVIHMGGCNFRCRFCNKGPLLDPILCKKVDTGEVFKKVMAGRELITGVVFTGGEPSVQPGPLRELCTLFKKESLAVKLDTNGSNSGVIADLLEHGLVDYIALDIKAPLENEHDYHNIIGVPPKKAKDTITKIHRVLQLRKVFPFRLECRTTVVPGIIYRDHDIEMIAKEVSHFADVYVLQQFTPEKGCLDPELNTVQPPSRAELRGLAKRAKRHVKDVRIRTAEMGEEKI